MPCSTFSRYREKRLASSTDSGPPPVRSIQYPKGLPGLTPAQLSRVSTDTSLAVRAIEWSQDSLGSEESAETLPLMENPRRSLLWHLREYRALAAHPVWFEAEYDACCYLSARRKAQTIAANTELIAKLEARCHHLHDSDERRKSEGFAQWKKRSTRRSSHLPLPPSSASGLSLTAASECSCRGSFLRCQQARGRVGASWMQRPPDSRR